MAELATDRNRQIKPEKMYKQHSLAKSNENFRRGKRKKTERRVKTKKYSVFLTTSCVCYHTGLDKRGKSLSRLSAIKAEKATMFGRPEANRDDQTPPYPNTRGGQRRGQIEHGDKSSYVVMMCACSTSPLRETNMALRRYSRSC